MSEMPFLEWFLRISNFAVMIGANLMVQTTIIISAGICSAYVLRKRGAALQSLILRVFLVAALFGPLLAPYMSMTGISRITVPVPRASFNKSEHIYFTDTHDTAVLPLTQAGELHSTLPKHDNGTEKLSPTVITSGKEHSPESFRKAQDIHASIPRSHETSLPVQPRNSSTALRETTEGKKQYFSVEIPLGEVKTYSIIQEYWNESHGLWEQKRSGMYIIFTVLWLVASLLLFMRLLLHTLYIQYIRRSAFTAKPSFVTLCNDLAHEAGLKAPLVFQSPSVKSPFLAGFLKPFILLPLGEQEISLASREIFLHELSHLRRYDHLWNLLRQIAIVIVPFQPLMWLLSRRIEETSDYVCDDYVMKHTGNHRSYALNLLTIAQFYQPDYREIIAGVGIISFKSPLRRRIERILDSSRSRIIEARTSARFVVSLLFLCVSTSFLSGFVGFERESIVRLSAPDETLFHTERIVATAQSTPVETGDERKAESARKGESATFTEAPAAEKSVIKPLDSDVYYGNLPVSHVSVSNDMHSIVSNSNRVNTEYENCSEPDKQVAHAGTPGAEFGLPDSSDEEESSYIPEQKSLNGIPEGETEKIADDAGLDTTDNVADKESDTSGVTSFVTESSGMALPSFRENRIKVPVAKPVMVEIDFDYENFDFDLKNKEERRLYNLYLGLDKHKNEPAWSPDGKWIAFTDHNRIWIVSSEGGEPELMYENFQEGYSVGNFESLCFTSDSKEITFKKDVYDIYRGSIITIKEYNEEGFATFSNPIPNIESVNIYTGEHRVLVEEGYRCCWSRSGRYLGYLNWDPAIYSAHAETDHHGMPAVYDVETGRKWFLPVDGEKRYGKPTFSPDDSHIVIPVREGSGPIELYRISLEEGEPEQLTFYDENTEYGKYINFPEYSPDGQWILYTDFTWKKSAPDKRLFVYNTVTGELSEVFENPERRNSYGKWSPNGKRICYLVEEDDGNYIYICDFTLSTPMKPAAFETAAPVPFTVTGNYPNPFNMSTTIEFSLPASGFVTLVIYNSMGQKVRELVSGQMTPGVHTLRWNGVDENGNHVSSGVYFSQLSMGSKTSAGRMTLLK